MWLISQQNHEPNTAMATAAVLPDTPAACTFAQDMGPHLAHLCVFLSESSVAAPPHPPQVLPQRVKWMNEQQSVSTLGMGI